MDDMRKVWKAHEYYKFAFLSSMTAGIGGHDPFLRSGTPLQFLGTEERTRYILKRVTDQVTSVTLVVRSSVTLYSLVRSFVPPLLFVVRVG